MLAVITPLQRAAERTKTQVGSLDKSMTVGQTMR